VDGVIVLDHKGRYLFANQSYCEIVGVPQDEIIGTMFRQGPARVTAKGLPDDILAHLATRGRWQGIVSYRKVGKHPAREVSQNFSEIYRSGNRVGYISNLHDISEERRLQREVEVYSDFLHKEVERQTEVIVQTQKMETVGILAAGFAHDFNNLLASMHGNIELMEIMIKRSPDKCVSYIEKIKQASLQAAHLTGQILLFSRRDVGGTEVMSVVELVESALALVPPSIPAQIVCDYLEDSDEIQLEVNRSALVQSLLNLILNAGESFPEDQSDARISVIAKVKFVDRYLGQRFNLIPGKWYCEITVSDNGSGIPPAMMKRIFDPFFSTKEWTNRKGTGLGLPIAYRTIANHNGIITVNSEVGAGSSFVIYLPVASGVKKPLASKSTEDYSHDLKARNILVIEDEEILRDSLKVLLEIYGGRVETAAHGQEALVILKESVIDLIVLDLIMPGMSGEEFLAAMEREKIKIPVIIMTGTVNEGFRVCKLYPVVMEVMEKPFSQKELLQYCSELLG
jgi:two-component system cell cycle sensor histidine kinase/response regulator CckA